VRFHVYYGNIVGYAYYKENQRIRKEIEK